MNTIDLELVARTGAILKPCLKAKPDLDKRTIERLKLLEKYNFSFLLLGLSPKRLILEGRLFDNEQVLPLLLHFAHDDVHCRYWVSEIFRQWIIFDPERDGFEAPDENRVTEFRDYFFKKYAHPLIEEFRRFVALCMIYPNVSNAPSGPVDMVWHSFILCTNEYWEFGRTIWVDAPHLQPDVKEQWLTNAPHPFEKTSFQNIHSQQSKPSAR